MSTRVCEAPAAGDWPAATAPTSRVEHVARAVVAAALCGAAFSPPLTNVGLALMLLAFAFLPEARARFRALLREPIAQATLAFIAVMALAMLWSEVSWPQRLLGLWQWRPLLLMLPLLALFPSASSKRYLAVVYVAFATAGALLSFVAFALGKAAIAGDPPGTVLRNPSTQSMALAMGLTLALALAVHWRSARARGLLSLAAGIVALNLLFVTTGRSGHAAAAVVLFVLLVMLGGRRRLIGLLALPVLGTMVVMASPVIQQRFALGWHEVQAVDHLQDISSMGMRVVMWRKSMELVRAAPWFGHGTGSFAAAYGKLASDTTASWRARPSADPHNQYLYVSASGGILGLVFFLLWVGMVAVQALKASAQPAARPWAAAALALLLAWCATSLFSSHFQTFSEGHLIAIALGVLLAPQRALESRAAQAASKTDS
ncbi:MAG TPA: O-antigen ligase family protein [Burkholderiaceae bacterium]|nr:O-antigen ligase family protein [Burkholderiaceae bacterium]